MSVDMEPTDEQFLLKLLKGPIESNPREARLDIRPEITGWLQRTGH